MLIETKLQELPKIELSYETYPTHRKVPPEYTIGLVIPRSKKYIAWFTFIEDQDVCLLLELNREKRVVHTKQIQVDFDLDGPHLALGTFLYGSLSYVQGASDAPRAFFIIEDILMYRAVSLRKLCFGIRLGILEQLLSDPKCLPVQFSDSHNSLLNVSFTLPMMFDAIKDGSPPTSDVPYKIHHVQYRSLTQILPYINVLDTIRYEPTSLLVNSQIHPQMLPGEDLSSLSSLSSRPHLGLPIRSNALISQRPKEGPGRCESNVGPLPQERSPTGVSRRETGSSLVHPIHKSGIDPIGKQRAIFLVTADLQSDIYHLTRDVLDPNSTYTTDVAYIPNYTVSVFMNSLFRNIKENRNLDAIEESDDEDDFYDMRVDKYVDLSKEIRMECVYHKKFRRWIPYQLI